MKWAVLDILSLVSLHQDPLLVSKNSIQLKFEKNILARPVRPGENMYSMLALAFESQTTKMYPL